jgi:hypothetical protein
MQRQQKSIPSQGQFLIAESRALHEVYNCGAGVQSRLETNQTFLSNELRCDQEFLSALINEMRRHKAAFGLELATRRCREIAGVTVMTAAARAHVTEGRGRLLAQVLGGVGGCVDLQNKSRAIEAKHYDRKGEIFILLQFAMVGAKHLFGADISVIFFARQVSRPFPVHSVMKVAEAVSSRSSRLYILMSRPLKLFPRFRRDIEQPWC